MSQYPSAWHHNFSSCHYKVAAVLKIPKQIMRDKWNGHLFCFLATTASVIWASDTWPYPFPLPFSEGKGSGSANISELVQNRRVFFNVLHCCIQNKFKDGIVYGVLRVMYPALFFIRQYPLWDADSFPRICREQSTKRLFKSSLFFWTKILKLTSIIVLQCIASYHVLRE